MDLLSICANKRYCKKQAGDDDAAWMKSHESKPFCEAGTGCTVMA